MTQYVRELAEAEHPLVYSSYIKSSPTGGLAYGEHCKVAHDRMERCLAAPNVVALVVVDDEAPGWVGAWLVGHQVASGVAVHYVYTKRDYRRLGMASKLLAWARLDSGDGLYVTSTVQPRWRDLTAKLGAAHMPLSRAIGAGE